MDKQGFQIDQLPELDRCLLVAGFEGWGNALDVSKAMATYLIRKLDAKPFARIESDVFYRYDENRPTANIEQGIVKKITPPGGSFYIARDESSNRDIVILKATEPSLNWNGFIDQLFELCEKLGVDTMVTLGSMYDDILHTDRIFSGIASDEESIGALTQKGVIPATYQGPGSIHSSILLEGPRRGVKCISLWAHCPYYLQGITHFGLLTHLGALLSFFGNFELDTEELEVNWKGLNKRIQSLVKENPELQAMIQELRKAKVKGSWENVKRMDKKHDKIIHLDRFLKPH